ncbi:MAG: ABC transporter substrate-binding protein [Methanoregula sp.]|nr:ABC transporter substrate-binding protein [Methanoregula sp.]
MKRNSTYILFALALFVIAAVVFAGCVSSDNTKTTTTVTTTTQQQLKTLNVGYLPNNGATLIFVAKEQGYFTDQGLNVVLSSFTNSADGTNAIIAKKIDVGGFGLAPLVFISKGVNETIIGGQMGEGAAVFTTPEKASQFKDLNSFKGKTVATVRAASGDIHFRGALQNAGLDLQKDLTIQELASPAAVIEALKSGKVDAGVVWTPFTETAPNQGLVLLWYTDQYYPKHPCCRIAVLTDELKTNRDTFVSYEKALIQAYSYTKSNPDGTLNDVIKYVQINRTDLQNAINSPHFYISPDPNTKAIDKTYDLMKSIGYINTTVNINDHIDTSVYKQALDELSKANPNNTVYQQLEADYQTLNV